MVRIWDFHSREPGSIPGCGIFLRHKYGYDSFIQRTVRQYHPSVSLMMWSVNWLRYSQSKKIMVRRIISSRSTENSSKYCSLFSSTSGLATFIISLALCSWQNSFPYISSSEVRSSQRKPSTILRDDYGKGALSRLYLAKIPRQFPVSFVLSVKAGQRSTTCPSRAFLSFSTIGYSTLCDSS